MGNSHIGFHRIPINQSSSAHGKYARSDEDNDVDPCKASSEAVAKCRELINKINRRTQNSRWKGSYGGYFSSAPTFGGLPSSDEIIMRNLGLRYLQNYSLPTYNGYSFGAYMPSSFPYELQREGCRHLSDSGRPALGASFSSGYGNQRSFDPAKQDLNRKDLAPMEIPDHATSEEQLHPNQTYPYDGSPDTSDDNYAMGNWDESEYPHGFPSDTVPSDRASSNQERNTSQRFTSRDPVDPAYQAQNPPQNVLPPGTEPSGNQSRYGSQPGALFSSRSPSTPSGREGRWLGSAPPDFPRYRNGNASQEYDATHSNSPWNQNGKSSFDYPSDGTGQANYSDNRNQRFTSNGSYPFYENVTGNRHFSAPSTGYTSNPSNYPNQQLESTGNRFPQYRSKSADQFISPSTGFESNRAQPPYNNSSSPKADYPQNQNGNPNQQLPPTTDFQRNAAGNAYQHSPVPRSGALKGKNGLANKGKVSSNNDISPTRKGNLKQQSSPAKSSQQKGGASGQKLVPHAKASPKSQNKTPKKSSRPSNTKLRENQRSFNAGVQSDKGKTAKPKSALPGKGFPTSQNENVNGQSGPPITDFPYNQNVNANQQFFSPGAGFQPDTGGMANHSPSSPGMGFPASHARSPKDRLGPPNFDFPHTHNGNPNQQFSPGKVPQPNTGRHSDQQSKEPGMGISTNRNGTADRPMSPTYAGFPENQQFYSPTNGFQPTAIADQRGASPGTGFQTSQNGTPIEALRQNGTGFSKNQNWNENGQFYSPRNGIQPNAITDQWAASPNTGFPTSNNGAQNGPLRPNDNGFSNQNWSENQQFYSPNAGFSPNTGVNLEQRAASSGMGFPTSQNGSPNENLRQNATGFPKNQNWNENNQFYSPSDGIQQNAITDQRAASPGAGVPTNQNGTPNGNLRQNAIGFPKNQNWNENNQFYSPSDGIQPNAITDQRAASPGAGVPTSQNGAPNGNLRQNATGFPKNQNWNENEQFYSPSNGIQPNVFADQRAASPVADFPTSKNGAQNGPLGPNDTGFPNQIGNENQRFYSPGAGFPPNTGANSEQHGAPPGMDFPSQNGSTNKPLTPNDTGSSQNQNSKKNQQQFHSPSSGLQPNAGGIPDQRSTSPDMGFANSKSGATNNGMNPAITTFPENQNLNQNQQFYSPSAGFLPNAAGGPPGHQLGSPGIGFQTNQNGSPNRPLTPNDIGQTKNQNSEKNQHFYSPSVGFPTNADIVPDQQLTSPGRGIPTSQQENFSRPFPPTYSDSPNNKNRNENPQFYSPNTGFQPEIGVNSDRNTASPGVGFPSTQTGAGNEQLAPRNTGISQNQNKNTNQQVPPKGTQRSSPRNSGEKPTLPGTGVPTTQNGISKRRLSQTYASFPENHKLNTNQQRPSPGAGFQKPAGGIAVQQSTSPGVDFGTKKTGAGNNPLTPASADFAENGNLSPQRHATPPGVQFDVNSPSSGFTGNGMENHQFDALSPGFHPDSGEIEKQHSTLPDRGFPTSHSKTAENQFASPDESFRATQHETGSQERASPDGRSFPANEYEGADGVLNAPRLGFLGSQSGIENQQETLSDAPLPYYIRDGSNQIPHPPMTRFLPDPIENEDQKVSFADTAPHLDHSKDKFQPSMLPNEAFGQNQREKNEQAPSLHGTMQTNENGDENENQRPALPAALLPLNQSGQVVQPYSPLGNRNLPNQRENLTEQDFSLPTKTESNERKKESQRQLPPVSPLQLNPFGASNSQAGTGVPANSNEASKRTLSSSSMGVKPSKSGNANQRISSASKGSLPNQAKSGNKERNGNIAPVSGLQDNLSASLPHSIRKSRGSSLPEKKARQNSIGNFPSKRNLGGISENNMKRKGSSGLQKLSAYPFAPVGSWDDHDLDEIEDPKPYTQENSPYSPGFTIPIPARNPGGLFLLKSEFDTFLQRYSDLLKNVRNARIQQLDNKHSVLCPRPYLDVLPNGQKCGSTEPDVRCCTAPPETAPPCQPAPVKCPNHCRRNPCCQKPKPCLQKCE